MLQDERGDGWVCVPCIKKMVMTTAIKETTRWHRSVRGNAVSVHADNETDQKACPGAYRLADRGGDYKWEECDEGAWREREREREREFVWVCV